MIVAIEAFKLDQPQYRKISPFFKEMYLQTLQDKNPFINHEEYNVNYYEGIQETIPIKPSIQETIPIEPSIQETIEPSIKEIITMNQDNIMIVYPNANQGFLEELYEKNINKIDWKTLSKNINISLVFFERYIDKVNFEIFCKYQNITIEFIEKYEPRINWKSLSSNKYITFKIIEKYCIRLNWKELCKNNSIPWKFLKRNIDLIIDEGALAELYSHEQTPLYYILRVELQIKNNTNLIPMLTKKNMTYDFIKQFQNNGLINEYNFDYLWENPYLDIEFIKEHINKINWKKFCANIRGHEEVILDNIYLINSSTWTMYYWMLLGWSHPHWTALCSNPNISEKVFDIIIASDIFLADRIDWDALCRNDSISEEFFFYYSNKINWTSICYNKNISPNFFELFIDRVDWNNIHNSPNLTANFIYKHLDKMVYI